LAYPYATAPSILDATTIFLPFVVACAVTNSSLTAAAWKRNNDNTFKRKSRGFLTNPAFATFAPPTKIVSPNLRLKSSWPERSDLHYHFSSLLRLPSCDLKAVRATTTVIKDATHYHFGSLIAWKLAAVFLFCDGLRSYAA
jgi:hypothetical protein